MTEIPGDGRVAAFVCAWNALQSAGDIRNQVAKQQQRQRREDAPLPDVYWAAVAEAAVFADLARVDMPTGIAACALISQVETAKQVALDTIASALGVDLSKIEGQQ